MSSVESFVETSSRRSLRSSVGGGDNPPPKVKMVVGTKRSVPGDDAPLLDSTNAVKQEEIELDDDDDSAGPPPLKKVARTSAGGGTIMWKTATGAPKQLAFKKIGSTTVNGGAKPVPPKTNGGTAPPLNLATALAGLLPTTLPTPKLTSNFMQKKPPVIIAKPVPKIISSASSASVPPLVRKRVDKVTNEICDGCVKSLPHLRRSLGRLEARMESVTSMIKQIVSRHSQQQVMYAPVRKTPTLIQRGMSSVPPSSSSPSTSSSLNGVPRITGQPTSMRFVPASAAARSNLASLSSTARKFVTDKTGRLSPGSLMYRMISRGLLTYRSPIMTTDEYYKQAPAVIKAHSFNQIQQVMADLVRSGLYKKSDPLVDVMDAECIFEKETELSKLGRLGTYDVTTTDFLAGCFDD